MEQSLTLWGLFSSGFIASTLLPGGSEILLVYLLDQQQHTALLLVAVATLGNGLGGVVTWGLGYWVGRRWPIKQLSPARQRALARLKRFGAPVLLLSWLPIIGDPLCFASGWLGQRFFWSLFFIVLGKAMRYSVLAWLTVMALG